MSRLLWLALFSAGCAVEEPFIGVDPTTTVPTSATAPDTTDCVATRTTPALDEVTVLGFSGADIEAVVAQERDDPFEYADGTLAQVHVSLTRAGDPELVVWDAAVTGVTCPEDSLEVPFTLRVTTDDGQIDATTDEKAGGPELPTGFFTSSYAPVDTLAGSIGIPADAESLSVVVDEREDGTNNGVLQWVITPPAGMTTEIDVGAWGSYRP